MLAGHPSSPWLEEPCPVPWGFVSPWLSQTGSPEARRSQGGHKALGEPLRVAGATCMLRDPNCIRDVSMSELQSEVWGSQAEWQLLT